MIAAAIGLGLVIGALVGLLGGGGSILAVPALVYVVDQPLPQAVATSLLVVGIIGLMLGALALARSRQQKVEVAPRASEPTGKLIR